MPTRRAAPFAPLLLLAACSAGEPAVENAYVQLPAVPGRPAAAYLTLDGGAEGAVLASVSVPAAERAEIHESMSHGGMMTMQPLERVPVPADGEVAMRPGGMHVMLFGLPPSIQPGSPVEMVLRFESGRTLRTIATARAAGDAPVE